MRSVIAPPQVLQVASPVSRIGPVTTRAGVTRGLCAFSVAYTASNSSKAMIGGTSYPDLQEAAHIHLQSERVAEEA